ncbi:hypothetical protein Hanom_Chr06g00575921 [Helianthus anomalus]
MLQCLHKVTYCKLVNPLETRLDRIWTIISHVTDDEIEKNEMSVPSNFLMVFKIFLMHSSQCKPTFNSTTYFKKKLFKHLNINKYVLIVEMW